MIYFPTWKIVVVIAVCALGVLYAAPNLLNRQTVDGFAHGLPDWLPVHQVNLGLDLQGGSHLLLRVDYEDVVRERLNSVVDDLRTELRAAKIGYTDLGVQGDAAGFTLRDPATAEQARQIVQQANPDLQITVDENNRVTARFTEKGVQDLRDNAVSQSIEIVRRRIDELGTNEPIIQRQGEDRILLQLPGVDNPEHVKNLLGQTARLTFHLVDETVSPSDIQASRPPAGDEILPSAQTGPDGKPVTQYAVRKRVIVSGEQLTGAQATFQDGRPVVSFNFDSAGGRRFGETTQQNVGRYLAIVLDNKVISAPVIKSPILGGSGIIEGGFTVETANDLALLLRAGALPAPLTVLEERTVGPGLGADSIAAGERASVIGFLLVCGFMVICYGLFGIMSCVALVFNLALIMAGLSILHATLTLPGIAGIVLTLGIAVDANVLNFERMREEMDNGRSVISAIDAGYSRAMATIIDTHLTTLVAAFLLFAFGSGPVKGFAVTLALGISTSLFTAVLVTRLMVVTWLRRTRPRVLPI